MGEVLAEGAEEGRQGASQSFRLEEAALSVVSSPITESLTSLSATLEPLVTHRALVQLSPACTYSPFQICGDLRTDAPALTALDVAALRPLIADGVYQGHVEAFGADNDVLVLASGQTEPAALLVVIGPDVKSVSTEAITGARTLWDLLTAHRAGMQADLDPATLNVSRAAAGARANVIAELSEAHATALTSILRVLRDQRIAPEDAVGRATQLAVDAVSDLRDRAEIDQAFSDQRSADAFDRLVTSLRRILRPRGVRIDVRRPSTEDGAERLLAHDVAAATAATVRAVAHSMAEPPENHSATPAVTRIHLSWVIVGAELCATIRDDGPGQPIRGAGGFRHLEERLAALGGRLRVEAVPDWGTTVTVATPLTANPERGSLLSPLTDRELDVLTRVADGRRNRQIAAELHVSESTVKFHVARIFDKLGVASRSEAAALALRAGVA